MSKSRCRVCGSAAQFIGTKNGAAKSFDISYCSNCGFTQVDNPREDFADIYNEEYYRGQGTDEKVHYVYELEHPEKTIRFYELSGIIDAVQYLKPGGGGKWLDYGCGNGALVRECRRRGIDAIGYERGWITRLAESKGIPVVESFQQFAPASFDVITATGVLEHVVNPIETLLEIRRLLKPGGLFFYETGNAAPQRGKILKWEYLRPDIHISLYEPRTLEYALERTGFESRFAGFIPGFVNIIRFMVLKNLGFINRSIFEKLLPWFFISRLVNRIYHVTDHPVAYAKKG
ncbi:MAG: methyltransferase/methylase [Parcubacteria group bacterium Gr01-1014_3]|nr:MAG: methyltransferase/methylase [Parcubacteria group bacterium Gr01-1014_3]